jgi:NAD(P)-dependent dehydrogenase (short-subunit alcohol dehydrogenase family)
MGIAFEGQVAIVTGAGSGIGRETALALARRGARLVVNDPAADLAGAVVAEIEAANGIAVAETSAVGTRDAADAIVAAALEAFGGVDILINNAGISRPAPFGEDSDADIELVLGVNLHGPYHLMRAVWPVMKAAGYGRILNTASSAAFGSGISGAYAASKAGVIGLTKEAAASGKAHGIKVNAVMPQAHTTLLDKHPDPAFRAWMARHFPARLVAEASAYLVSRDVAVTGELFAAGGGLVRRIAFHESAGWLDDDLTAEVVAERIDAIMAVEGGHVFATQGEHGANTARRFPAI